jgi:hypothetical protein
MFEAAHGLVVRAWSAMVSIIGSGELLNRGVDAKDVADELAGHLRMDTVDRADPARQRQNCRASLRVFVSVLWPDARQSAAPTIEERSAD